MENLDTLPRDAQSILELAARSMFELFSGASEGMMRVDRSARGVQNTQMHQVLETGKPILIDLLTNRAGTFGFGCLQGK